MPDLFALSPSKQSNLLYYNSNRDGYALGEACRVCNKNITHHQSISPCQCFRYCHSRCLMQTLNEQNSNNESMSVRCQICANVLTLTYTIDLSFKCNSKPMNIIGLSLSTLFIIMLVNLLTRISIQQIGQLAIIVIMLCTSFCMFFLFFINTVAVKHYRIISIGSTNLAMVVSAFIDLQHFKEGFEQNTQAKMLN